MALVLSSENKLYVLLIGVAGDESGQITVFAGGLTFDDFAINVVYL